MRPPPEAQRGGTRAITSLQNERVKMIRSLHMRKARRETGLFDQFVANLTAALDQNPTDTDSRRWLADGLLLAGDAERAVPHYELLVRQLPEDPYPLGQLARACKRLGDLEGANRWIRRALEQRPDDRLALSYRAYALARSGRAGEARLEVARFLPQAGADRPYWAWMARSLAASEPRFR